MDKWVITHPTHMIQPIYDSTRLFAAHTCGKSSPIP